MSEWMVGWTVEYYSCVSECMDMEGWMDWHWIDEWIDRDKCMFKWMNGCWAWMDEWMNEHWWVIDSE